MTLATRIDFLKNMARGKGAMSMLHNAASTTATAASFTAGGFSLQLVLGQVGTTLPGTFKGMIIPPVTDRVAGGFEFGTASSRASCLAFIYKIGTVNLAATGNQLTHVTPTFPLTRRIYGVNTQPISLIPVITTATATTQAVLRLETAAGGNGYVNQGGTSVVGNRSLTLPAAVTAVNSCYPFMLNDGDCGVRDILQVRVTAAASAGAAGLWGIEPLLPTYYLGSSMSYAEGLISAVLADLGPAVATSGTVESHLAVVTFGESSNPGSRWGTIVGARNV
jgi:hypothetical protein